eukprot:GILI01019793.1.p1 GENE.GILI01019793.1~~GILI01019793.1.p1  ORF type:complete len:453 (+),score=49.20 GILI01019793.1:58-1359(+)
MQRSPSSHLRSGFLAPISGPSSSSSPTPPPSNHPLPGRRNVLHPGGSSTVSPSAKKVKEDIFRQVFLTPHEERLKDETSRESHMTGTLAPSLSPSSSSQAFSQSLDPDFERPLDTRELQVDDGTSAPPVSPNKKKPASVSLFSRQIQIPCPIFSSSNSLSNSRVSAIPPPFPTQSSGAKQNFDLLLRDFIVRAQAGAQAGDLQKEAHMCFYLGVLNEERKHFQEALRAYRRFLFCSRQLQDKEAEALALNRVAVTYHNLGQPSKSLEFHQKHYDSSGRGEGLAAMYNMGLCLRNASRHSEAVPLLQQALEAAVAVRDFEAHSLTLGQLGLCFIALNDKANARRHLEKCLEASSSLGNNYLRLEVALMLGSLTMETEDFEASREFYREGLAVARSLGDNANIELCQCQMGVADGNLKMKALESKMRAMFKPPKS